VFVTRRLGLPEIAPKSAISGMTAMQHSAKFRLDWGLAATEKSALCCHAK
jgi:hypothetical protein